MKGIKLLMVSVMIAGNVLLRTEATSADLFAERKVAQNTLQAITLSFSESNTANGSRSPHLFNVAGLKPGGFDVRAIRLRNESSLDVPYALGFSPVDGTDAVCAALDIEAQLNGEKIYEGALSSLSADSKLGRGAYDDWVFFVRLDKRDAPLKNGRCGFNFVFKSRRGSQDAESGFSARQDVYNSVALGVW